MRPALSAGVAHRLKSSVRGALNAARELAHTAQVWRAEAWSFPAPDGVDGRVAWLGRRESTAAAREAFGGSGPSLPGLLGGVVVTELPRPGALRVPVMVRLSIDVHGTLDEVLARASHGVWRRAKPLVDRVRVTPVTSDADVARVNAELLVPYAARHGEATNQVPFERVLALARRGGLVTVELDGEVVAARLGYEFERAGRRCFAAWRFGYPARVFEDAERYGVMNSLNTLLAIRHAHDGGFAALDFGLSPATPVENGQLQFKRLRGAAVTTTECHSFFWLTVPPARAPDFFWARPVLSLEHGALVLNLGVPEAVSDAMVRERLHKRLTFGGVGRVRLHTPRGCEAMAADVV